MVNPIPGGQDPRFPAFDGTKAAGFDKLSNRPLVDFVVLPSLGLPYGDRMPGGKIRISAITVREEKIFVSSAASPEQRATSLIDATCDLGSLTSEELLLGDRFFLLMQLRAKSYGTEYGFSFRCEDCEHQWRHTIDISRSLKLRNIPKTWDEPWDLQLPISRATVSYRMLRGEDESNIAKLMRKKAQKNTGKVQDSSYALTIAAHIVKINDSDVDDITALPFVESLVGSDVNLLRDAIESKMPGYDPDIEITCPACGYEHLVGMPMSAEFFRPRGS